MLSCWCQMQSRVRDTRLCKAGSCEHWLKMLGGRPLHCQSFFGFFRSGEITIPAEGAFDPDAHLSFDNVMVDSVQTPQLVRVRLKLSKTDPFRKGVDVFVGRTGNDLCPVAAMLAYMVQRGKGPSPFFRFQDGGPLTRREASHGSQASTGEIRCGQQGIRGPQLQERGQPRRRQSRAGRAR